MAKDTRQTAAERWIFLGSCVAGIALLWLLRFRLDVERSAITAAAVLCVLILLCAWILHSRNSFRLQRNVQSADNLYYLGFIFTICALAVSLIRFGTADGATTLDIVGDLGVGLSTTVVGLILRALALHREDPAEIEDRVCGELIDVAESTTAMIRLTADVVEQGQIVTRQTIDELNKTLQQTADQIGAGVREVRESPEAVRIPPDLNVSRLTPGLAQLSESVSTLAEKLDAIDIPTDLVASRVERAAVEATVALTDAVNNSGRVIRRRLSDVADAVAAQAQETIKGVEASVLTRVGEIEIPTDLVTRRVEPLLSGRDECTTKLENSFQGKTMAVSNIEKSTGRTAPGLWRPTRTGIRGHTSSSHRTGRCPVGTRDRRNSVTGRPDERGEGRSAE